MCKLLRTMIFSAQKIPRNKFIAHLIKDHENGSVSLHPKSHPSHPLSSSVSTYFPTYSRICKQRYTFHQKYRRDAYVESAEERYPTENLVPRKK